MATDSYEFDPTPGFTKGTHVYGTEYGDDFHAPAVQELLLSAVGYTQRGVTLAGGQGILPTGCVLARKTTDGKYYAYQSAGTSGLNVPVGVLRDARDTGGTTATNKVATDCQANLVYRGILNANLLSGTDTTSLVSGGPTGVSTGTVTTLGGRVTQFYGPVSGESQGSPFPGGPMDGGNAAGTAGVSAFIF